MNTSQIFRLALVSLLMAGPAAGNNVLTFTADTERFKLPDMNVSFLIPTGAPGGVLVFNSAGTQLAGTSTIAGSTFDPTGTAAVTGFFQVQFPPATTGWFTFSVPTPYGGRLITERQYVMPDGAGDLTFAENGGAIPTEAFPHGTVWKTELISRFGFDGPNTIVENVVDAAAGAGLGSGVEFWPAEGVFLVADNNANNLRRMNTNGTILAANHTIALNGFWDVEEVRVTDAANNEFAISQEYQGAATPNEIVIIQIPPGTAAINRANAIRILRPVLTQAGFGTEIGTVLNLGYEAMACDNRTGLLYFCLEKQSTAAGTTANFWNVWSVPNDGGNGAVPFAPNATRVFSLNGIKLKKANDISTMDFSPWNTLVLGADEGAGTTAAATATQLPRLLQFSMTGGLIDDTLPPPMNVAGTQHFRQLEGLCFRRTAAGVLQMVLTGEKDGTAGADWQVLE